MSDLTRQSKKSMANLIVDCVEEIDIHNVLQGFAARGMLNRVTIMNWLKRTIKMIWRHKDYRERILSHGLTFKQFDGLVRKVICKYFDRLPGGGELRRAAMLGMAK